MAPNENCTSVPSSQQPCHDVTTSDCQSPSSPVNDSPSSSITSPLSLNVAPLISEPNTDDHPVDTTPIRHSPSRRFTVSPVPNGSLALFQLNYANTNYITDRTNENKENELQPLLTPEVTVDARLGASPSDHLSLPADWRTTRCRHESEISCRTVSTVLSTVDELETNHGHGNGFRRSRDNGNAEDGTETDGSVPTSPGGSNYSPNHLPSIILPETVLDSPPLCPRKKSGLYRSSGDESHHPEETLAVEGQPTVSQWDVSNRRRDDAIQFYVGSTYTLRSAASSISFFNTLYAKGYAPICRICHQVASETQPLETPCHCQGSLRFVHHACLINWLDERQRHSGSEPLCELCQFHYHPRRVWRSWRNFTFPEIPLRDKMLHWVFLLGLICMAVCAGVASSLLNSQLEESGVANDVPTEEVTRGGALTRREMLSLACGIFFFLGFFVTVTSQIKAKWSLCAILRTFVAANYVLYLDSPSQKPNNTLL